RELAQKHRPVHRDVLRRLHGAVGHSDRGVLAAKYRRRAVGGAGRDQLGANRLSNRRDNCDSAIGLADAGILFRALQGALGASMIPIVFTSSLYYFQGPRRVYSAAVVGSIASVAPTLGPIIGGWITDAWNWHWLFYVNLAPGIAITLLVPFLVDID